eukprot:TRINITY_DN22858_c0_g1_i1.p3 TRINITY_DN22858_c0_g1~~TRINITY_DN22858_c0_g1_i1.p3  ORF type:complete len:102 (+),score=16.00 TRINITY_DN22858_c0_g1_i1:212-517(+)
MKGSGIWLDLGKTISFSQHFEAYSYFLPGYKIAADESDTVKLVEALKNSDYDTIQFYENNENDIFIYEILDGRYSNQGSQSCPNTTEFIFQYSSKPYNCSC